MIGDIISAGAKLVGGYMDSQQQEKNREMQMEFAKNGIQWKVEDAKKAGIHPLYALGAPTMSPAIQTGGGMGAALSSAGQDIGRAINATRDAPARDEAFQKTVNEMQLQNMTMRNELLQSQIQRFKQQGNPPMPSGGSGEVLKEGKMKDTTRLMVGGHNVTVDPAYSDTQEMSNRYGDENPLVQWVYGPYLMWRDYMNTTGGMPGRLPETREGGRATFHERFNYSVPGHPRRKRN